MYAMLNINPVVLLRNNVAYTNLVPAYCYMQWHM